MAIDRLVIRVQAVETPFLNASGVRLEARPHPSQTHIMGELRIQSFTLPEKAAALDLPPTQIEYVLTDKTWRLSSTWSDVSIATLKEALSDQAPLPEDLEITGNLKVRLEASGLVDRLAVKTSSVTIETQSLNFTNEAGDLAGENLAIAVRLSTERTKEGHQLSAQVDADRGAALIGLVYTELTSNPLAISVTSFLSGNKLDIRRAAIDQRDILSASAYGQLTLADDFSLSDTRIDTAQINLQNLRFPAAYATLLQTALAGTVLGSLDSSGEISGELEVRDSALQQARIDLSNLDFRDRLGRLRLEKLSGALHWRTAASDQPPDSILSWQRAGAYGVDVGSTTLALRWHGDMILALQPFRIPIFDGALRTDHLLIKNPTSPEVRLEFSGEIEPISMPEVAKAFDWPIFAGTIRSRIPNVSYSDKILQVDGDITADIFGGRLVGRNIRLVEPLGRWPRLSADISFADFDLEMLTQTFEFGSISGKVEGRIGNLELFAWNPVSFDALIRTPVNDRTRHRISVKAINSLSNIGGNAGGGVAAALQGGMMRFFTSYGYKSLTLRCRLKNDVCVMGDTGAEDERYYLLEGRGLPRIDIIGYAGRVRWSQLVQQIGDQL